jgi:hypothetical protein
MYGAVGQTDPWQSVLRDVLAIPALQPLEAKVVQAVDPYLPTVSRGFLAGWWATNKAKIVPVALGGLVLWLVLRKR